MANWFVFGGSFRTRSFVIAPTTFITYRPKGPGVFFLLYAENAVKKCTHVTIINDTTTTTTFISSR